MTIVAAADGSALGNPGPAGWAWYVDDSCWRAGGWPHGTNNMGELMAVLDLFRSTAHIPEEPLHILCDSQYVINCITKWMPGWKRKGWRKADGKPVLNVDLLKDIDDAIVGRKYKFEWVKGHAGHDLNEAADDRARDAATAYQAKRAPNAGPGFAGAPVSSVTSPAATSAATPAVAPAERAALADDMQPDLFSSLLDDDVDPAYANASNRETIVALERELMTPTVREDSGRVALLLHPDFEEIGASGRLWGRDEILGTMSGTDLPGGTLEVLNFAQLDDATALLTYRSIDARGAALRSSLWRRDNGQWRVRFHQGTFEA